MGSCQGSEDASSPAAHQKLWKHYTLGKVVGQGAFADVYLCESKKDNKEYAVKMIDKMKSPLKDIEREVQMLKDLAHERVVKLVDVYYEKAFVCMVMEIYRCGNMIKEMQHHSKATLYQAIPCSSMKHLALQMLQSVEFLHSKECIHRDVKCDNFLMDRKDLVDPQCQIFLCDFGTLTKCKPGERLTSSCGTQSYWAPEFYDYNYAEKVDVWAMGVVMYGLVEGDYPFKGEADTREKMVNLPSRCPDELKEFILGLLQKKEAERLSASAALASKWFKSATTKEETSGVVQDFEVKEAARNAGVAERRGQLVDRVVDDALGDRNSLKGNTNIDLQMYCDQDFVYAIVWTQVRGEWQAVRHYNPQSRIEKVLAETGEVALYTTESYPLRMMNGVGMIGNLKKRRGFVFVPNLQALDPQTFLRLELAKRFGIKSAIFMQNDDHIIEVGATSELTLAPSGIRILRKKMSTLMLMSPLSGVLR